jgi:release factor glutamine methyltransferase
MSVSIGAALREAAEQLRGHEIHEPRREAALLLGHILRRDRAFVFAHIDEDLSPEQLEVLGGLVSRRGGGEPLQYITEHQEFFKLDFEVTPDVLIPRPETELVVEGALDVLPRDRQSEFVDVGTGSGCLAISILHEHRKTEAIAIDLSTRALQVAERNAERHGVADRLRLLESDLLAALPADQIFDLIVSNPPYISSDDMEHLQREVQREPRRALEGGRDGLDIVRRLIREAFTHLKKGGHLIFEFGLGQDAAIRELVDRDVWELIEVRKDLQQIPRTIILRRDAN